MINDRMNVEQFHNYIKEFFVILSTSKYIEKNFKLDFEGWIKLLYNTEIEANSGTKKTSKEENSIISNRQHELEQALDYIYHAIRSYYSYAGDNDSNLKRAYELIEKLRIRPDRTDYTEKGAKLD